MELPRNDQIWFLSRISNELAHSTGPQNEYPATPSATGVPHPGHQMTVEPHGR